MDEGSIELATEQGFVSTTLAERLYPNMSSFPGQINFLAPLLSPKQETWTTRQQGVRMARQAERTSEQLRGGREKHTDMVVGAGLFVRPTPDWDLLPSFTKEERKAFSNACRAQFNNWAYDKSLRQDAEGALNFNGQMWMAYHYATGPEAETVGAIVRDPRRAEKLGANWETYVNVIHPARLQTPPLLAGREEELGIFQGKQLDEWGAWEGLYILKKHPSEGGLNASDYEFIPRFTETGCPQAWHFFTKTEGGAQRGIAQSLTILSRVFQVNKLYEGTVGAAILDSLYSFFVKSGADPQTVAERLAPNPLNNNLSSFDLRSAFYKAARIRFGGQRVPVLPDGDEIEMLNSGRAAQDPTGLFNVFLREHASNTGTTFEQIANNWSDANYSAARAAFEDIWRTIMRKRDRFVHVPSLCYSAVIEEAIDRQRIILPSGAPDFYEMREAYTRSTWMGPGKIEIDPEKAAKANEIELRIKTKTRDQIWSDRGQYYYDGFVQYAEELEEAGDLGFDLDPPLPGQLAPGEAPASGAGDPESDQSGNQRRKTAK